jgi:UDP-N-acetylmuramate--alanine ligase
MRTIPLDIGTLHFIGIGGIGMSGIAEVLHDLGYAVQGSDLTEGGNVQRLRDKGIRIAVGHGAQNLVTEEGDVPAVVVISSAVKCDNPELIAAREQLLPVVRRAEMLAELMRLKWAVAIGGTHGKTTTTSMVGAMLEEGNFDPTVINGGIVNAYGTNTRMGSSDWMVVEADESDGTFTRLPATVVVVTNMDPEHMEHYGTFDGVRDAYRQFVENIPFYGFAALCLDHPEVQKLVAAITDRRVITYGFNPQADVQARDVAFKNGVATYNVIFAPWMNDGEELVLEGVKLPMLGLHNVQNSLAALTVGHAIGMKPPMMKRALEKFAGVKRRFTKTGETHGVTVIDDYGHHPVEIAAVLKAGRMAVADTGGKIVAVYQPHRYTRLSSLFDEFCHCFNDAEIVIVADVYAAGEQPIDGADKKHLVEGIKLHGHRYVMALGHSDELAATVAKLVQPGDFVICLGAGNITQWAYALPGQLDELLRGQEKVMA